MIPVTHSNEKQTLHLVSPGFELTIPCIWYSNYHIAVKASAQLAFLQGPLFLINDFMYIK